MEKRKYRKRTDTEVKQSPERQYQNLSEKRDTEVKCSLSIPNALLGPLYQLAPPGSFPLRLSGEGRRGTTWVCLP